ncbi:hypothetical protein FPF71_05380 [Algibacter amylolyticus]|uniref:HNH endonuclease n=1 Tax=Algibacter amylolyticus TaxID=1608400 RepID=A0A5M7BDB7_9FLAO|nr:hypothetical protein [Algibacter amylolyticus]KAA5826247.1 hypothetical protein F2B50_05380 [Algibacter amylolyticus]MBB5268450.1 5-methylcytosine-specific restriction endonuclease McrA [Algibacter amylolyticus]TSJ80285.1 hypothetical protein FPF71_05380 [Algibacter amylolyticus]
MTYNEQLSTKEWLSKREEIINRDNSKCQHCNIYRSEILGLSSKFGVKSYFEMRENDFSLQRKKNTNDFVIYKKNWEADCKFIGTSKALIKIEDLLFAQKYVEQPFVINKYIHVCFNQSQSENYYDLNVHHKYYQKGKSAWEYDNEALITLCRICHKKEHMRNKIPILDSNGIFVEMSKNCNRCDGSGYLSEYKHVKNGVCFGCMGTGSINIY